MLLPLSERRVREIRFRHCHVLASAIRAALYRERATLRFVHDDSAAAGAAVVKEVSLVPHAASIRELYLRRDVGIRLQLLLRLPLHYFFFIIKKDSKSSFNLANSASRFRLSSIWVAVALPNHLISFG